MISDQSRRSIAGGLICLLLFCSLYGADDKCFFYLDKEEIEHVEHVDRSIYQEAVKQLPICCVDVFLYDPASYTYLLVLRDNPPASGVWWIPGGRLFKGESFFDCAIRKCREEVGLAVQPITHLGFAATLFPDSAWGCQTHTVSAFILAKIEGSAPIKLDAQSRGWIWRSLDSPPEDPYLNSVYQEAMKILSH